MTAPITTVALFPGQGVDVTALRATTRRLRPDLVAVMDATLGRDAFAAARHGTADAQPAVYCASLARWGGAARDGVRMFCGHSLGEITALAAAGWLDHHAGLRLVIERGRSMEAAGRGRDGGMLVVVAPLDDVVALARRHRVAVANDNAPGQVVVSGPGDALERLAHEARRRSIVTLRLAVTGAFHSPMMAPAVERFRAALTRVELTPVPGTLVMSAISATPFTELSVLAEGLTAPVRWRETVLALQETGARRFVDVGPGKVVAGMVRRILPEAVVAVGTGSDEDDSPKSSTRRSRR